MNGQRRRSSRRWTWLFAPVLVGGGVFFGTRIGRAKPEPIDPALVVTVARRSLDVEILETGRIQPREKVELKSKIAGQVADVFVREGDRVKKGDVVLTLDRVDVQRELDRAEADVAQARAGLDFAALVHERCDRGVTQQITSRSDLDQAAHEHRSKAATLQAAEVARTIARDHLLYTKVLSPIDGTVIARGIEPGESVVPGVQSTFDGKALLTIADLSALLVKVNLNQIDVAKVAVGRRATLTVDALPGHSYDAIGIRKALGARPSEIGAQFLTEAVLLSLAGGGAGVGGGLAVAFGVSRLVTSFVPSWQASLAPVATTCALLVSIAIGVLFGWLPAQSAAKLDPVVAMRR